MTHEQLPSTQNTDQGLQSEISLSNEIGWLRHNPAIGCEDLFSSNKMENDKYPDKPGVRVALHTPIESAISSRSDVEQELMAVVALGQNVALGVVKGKDSAGEEVSYVSLLNSNRSDNGGRARIIDVLRDGSPLTIGRDRIEQVVGREGSAPGVSGRHCTIELKDGILTVVDETSTNGTSLFTNTTKQETRAFPDVYNWSQPSPETKQLIEGEKEAKRLSRASKLGRFIVNNQV